MTTLPDLPKPPAHIAPYVAALGVDGAVAFLLNFGGASAYLGERVQARNRLLPVIGEVGVQALVKVLGPGRIDRVPAAGKWVAQVWYARGRSVSEIARDLHTTDKTVRQWVKGWRDARATRRQLDLFAG